MKFILIVLSLVFFYSCSHIDIKPSKSKKFTSANLEQIDLNVTKRVLPNGLTILIVENHNLPIASYYTFYKVGGRHETKGITGSTHFLEHLMFKGTNKFGPGQFEKIVEGNGGNSNAYTTFDLTVYHENIPSSALGKIIEVEADRMNDILLEPEAFKKEKQVILEERKYRYENSPRGQMYLAMLQEMYKGTPYGGSVIGHIPDIKSVTREQIFDYFKKFYAPNNAVLVVVGNVDVHRTLELIQHHYGPLKASKGLAAVKKKRDRDSLYKVKKKRKSRISLRGTSKNPMFALAYPADKLGTRRAYVLDILSSILGDGRSSFLNKNFVNNKRPVVSSIYAANYNMDKNGIFFIGGELLPKKSIKGFEKKLKKNLNNFCKKGIDERSLMRTLNQYMVSFYNALQTNAGVASFLGNREVLYGDYRIYKKEIEIYESITTEELKTACHELFGMSRPLFVNVWDRNKKR